jgi:hypothetical protein
VSSVPLKAIDLGEVQTEPAELGTVAALGALVGWNATASVSMGAPRRGRAGDHAAAAVVDHLVPTSGAERSAMAPVEPGGAARAAASIAELL